MRRGVVVLALLLAGCDALAGKSLAPAVCPEYRLSAITQPSASGVGVDTVAYLKTCVRP